MCVFWCHNQNTHLRCEAIHTPACMCPRSASFCDWLHICMSMNTCVLLCVGVSSAVWSVLMSCLARGLQWWLGLRPAPYLSVQHSAGIIGCKVCVRAAKKSSQRHRRAGRVRWANSPSAHRWESEVDLAVTQVSLRQECHAWFHSIKCEIEGKYHG